MCNQGRLYHLDYLRAGMMFLGVLVHASHADFGAGNFSAIREISGAFRMECFFLISGFFSYILLERRKTLPFFKRRIVSLLVPALTCVILFVPITNRWMVSYFEMEGNNEYVTGWAAHTWFLFSLIIYTLALISFAPLFRNYFNALSQKIPTRLLCVAVFLSVIICSLIAKKAITKFGVSIPSYEHWGFIVSTSAAHFPYFFVGAVMAARKDIFDIFHGNIWFWLALSVFFISCKIIIGDVDITTTTQDLSLMTLGLLVGFSLCGLLISFAYRHRHKDIFILKLMSDSAYTVYLIHYIIIAFVLTYTQQLNISITVKMLLAFIAACLIGIGFHMLIVKRFAVAGILFNGKIFKKAELAGK